MGKLEPINPGNDEAETLPPVGELRDWMVKNFPVKLRIAIGKAADERKMNVASFVAHHFEKHGIDGLPFDLPAALVLREPPDELRTLERLTTLACHLASVERQRSPAIILARRLVTKALADLAQAAGSAPPTQIAAPEQARPEQKPPEQKPPEQPPPEQPPVARGDLPTGKFTRGKPSRPRAVAAE